MIDLLYILAFTVFFSFFDYIGYNESVKHGWVNEKFINPYRIVQGSVQIILLALAWYFIGWIVSLGFFLLWWTWNCDLIYYFLHDTLKIYLPTGAFKREVMGNQVTWAWWTPYGLYLWVESGTKGEVINGSTLLWQSWIGILITILIVLIWQNIQIF